MPVASFDDFVRKYRNKALRDFERKSLMLDLKASLLSGAVALPVSVIGIADIVTDLWKKCEDDIHYQIVHRLQEAPTSALFEVFKMPTGKLLFKYVWSFCEKHPDPHLNSLSARVVGLFCQSEVTKDFCRSILHYDSMLLIAIYAKQPHRIILNELKSIKYTESDRNRILAQFGSRIANRSVAPRNSAGAPQRHGSVRASAAQEREKIHSGFTIHGRAIRIKEIDSLPESKRAPLHELEPLHLRDDEVPSIQHPVLDGIFLRYPFQDMDKLIIESVDHIDDEQFMKLMQVMPLYSQVSRLVFHSVSLEDDRVVYFNTVLKSFTRLSTLSLSANNLGGNVKKISFAGLSSLRSLAIDTNDLDDEDLAYVANSLTHIPNLESLYLFDNLFKDAGASALVRCLSTVPSLTRLFIHGALRLADLITGCPITESVAKMLISCVLKYLPNLRYLNCYSLLDEEPLEAALKTLEASRRWSVLIL